MSPMRRVCAWCSSVPEDATATICEDCRDKLVRRGQSVQFSPGSRERAGERHDGGAMDALPAPSGPLDAARGIVAGLVLSIALDVAIVVAILAAAAA